MSKRKFGELESLILQIVKKRKKASVKDIHKILDEKVAYTTIMTVMQRLFEKSYLEREKIGKSFIYNFSKKSKKNFLKVVENIKSKIFSNSTFDMVTYLLNDETITKFEIEKIEKLIKETKEKL